MSRVSTKFAFLVLSTLSLAASVLLSSFSLAGAQPSLAQAAQADAQTATDPASEGEPRIDLTDDPPPAPYVNLQVALETDADAELVDSILKPLESRGMTAAVYVAAAFAQRHPAAVASIVRRGHELGVLATAGTVGMSLEQQTKQIGGEAATVRQAAGLATDAPLHLRLADYVQPYTAIRPLETTTRV